MNSPKTHAFEPGLGDVLTRRKLDRDFIGRIKMNDHDWGTNGVKLTLKHWGDEIKDGRLNQFTQPERERISIDFNNDACDMQINELTHIYKALSLEAFNAFGVYDLQRPIFKRFEVNVELPLPSSQHDYNEAFLKSVNQVFPRLRQIENPGAGKHKGGDHLYWTVPDIKFPGSSHSKQKISLKCYEKNGYLRVEIVFENYEIPTSLTKISCANDIDEHSKCVNAFALLLATEGKGILKRLLHALQYSVPVIDKHRFMKALKSFQLMSVDTSTKYQELYESLDRYGNYTPSDRPLNKRLNPKIIEKLSHPTTGIFEVQESKPRKVIKLRDDWTLQLQKAQTTQRCKSTTESSEETPKGGSTALENNTCPTCGQTRDGA